MDLLKAFFSFLRHVAVVLQTILSLMNAVLWATIFYIGYRLSQDPTLIYQLPMLIVKAVSDVAH